MLVVDVDHPTLSQRGMLTLYWFNAGPPSQTVAQHRTNMESTPRGHSRAQSRIVVTPERRAALRHWSGIVTACDATGCLRDTASGWWLSTNAATGHLWTARTSPQRGVFSSGIRLLYHLLCNFAGDAITGGPDTKWIHTYLIERAAGRFKTFCTR